MVDFTEFKRDALTKYLRNHIQGEVRFDRTSRRLYSTDASIYQIEPLGVVIPKTPEDLAITVQVASEMNLSLTPRGGGTSLSGQSIGPGIVVDCSKYLNQIVDFDVSGRKVKVQPGVILDQLNRFLEPHDLQFGPDVATASRANLGGMIGNNSAGARSIVYGKTVDHVEQLAVLLADGSRMEVGFLSSEEANRRAGRRSLEGTIYREVRRTVLDHAEAIRKHFPRILRRVSGYNLDSLLGQMAESAKAGAPGEDLGPCNLVPLIVGSEGTLAFVTEAVLRVIPRPRFRGLLVPQFSTIADAMNALSACLELQPSAVELMDQLLLDLARENLSLRDTMAAIKGRPAALFMVEFSGDSRTEVADRVERLSKRLRGLPGITAIVPALDPSIRDPLWHLRRASMPLLLGMHGDRKPVTFVEDTAVSPERLPEFVARFRGLLQDYGTDGAFYGHASVGCLHIRPLLNLKDGADVVRMRTITEKVTDLVLEFNGALSGEHGDGLARSEWNRKMFGPEVYDAFCRVKQIFDPHNLFNPGKVVHAPPMTENLRYGSEYQATDPETQFTYQRQEGFGRSIELCNGSGVCRKLQGGTMCPSFRATRDEKDSTRGRANALRLALSGEQPLHDLRSAWLFDVLDLCLMCKACKSECPSNVDMAKLKAEFLNFYYRRRPRPLGQWMMAHVHLLNRMGAPAAPLVNLLQEMRPLRWLLEKFGGIDRRRSLPRLHASHFRRWFGRHIPSPSAGLRGKVLLLDDCFTTYNEPEIGRAAVRVLEHAGYAVELANLTCCGRPMISKGFLPQAKELIQSQLLGLSRRLTEGVPLLGIEPSCLFALADEWRDLVPSEEAERVASACELADGWLARQVKSEEAASKFRENAQKCLVHGHCHQKALVGSQGTVNALRMIPGLETIALDTGCCGMAGSFGFERKHYDLSVQIANLSVVPALAAEPDALVVAPGTSCRHQIKDLTERKAWHPLQVLEMSMGSREGKELGSLKGGHVE